MSLITVTPKFDAFVKFCSEQDPTNAIYHLGGYDQCAIGAFTTAVEGRFVDDAFEVAYEIVDELEVVSKNLGEQFIQKVGNGAKHPDIATYGGMDQWLHQFQHKVVEAAQ